MKLKHALARKWSESYYPKFVPGAETLEDALTEAYIAGFDRCKAHYVDFAKRFIGNPGYKPEDLIAAMERIGEKEGYLE